MLTSVKTKFSHRLQLIVYSLTNGAVGLIINVETDVAVGECLCCASFATSNIHSQIHTLLGLVLQVSNRPITLWDFPTQPSLGVYRGWSEKENVSSKWCFSA